MEKWRGGREKERERERGRKKEREKRDAQSYEGREWAERERERERVYLQRYSITADGINFSVVPYFLRREGNLKSIRSHPISIVRKVAPVLTQPRHNPYAKLLQKIEQGLDKKNYWNLKWTRKNRNTTHTYIHAINILIIFQSASFVWICGRFARLIQWNSIIVIQGQKHVSSILSSTRIAIIKIIMNPLLLRINFVLKRRSKLPLED